MDMLVLVKIFGSRATLIHGDPLALDRWLWLKKRLPLTGNGETLIDAGCGTGAFTMLSSFRGYEAIGASWDERNQRVAGERAKICKADNVSYEVLDLRKLDERTDWVGRFDFAINTENIEHIFDDRKLLRDITACLKPGGRLLLTAPYLHYRPILPSDGGPFSKTEDGGHVRRGYSKAMLEELCEDAGLVVEEFSYVSGVLSQKIWKVQRLLSKVHPLLGWTTILPLRVIPPIFDKALTKLLKYPHFSIGLEAYKPRFSKVGDPAFKRNARKRRGASASTASA